MKVERRESVWNSDEDVRGSPVEERALRRRVFSVRDRGGESLSHPRQHYGLRRREGTACSRGLFFSVW